MQPIARVEGVVQQGKRVGRTLGVPTANLPHPGEAGPPNGIYVARVLFANMERPAEQAVLSQGFHPTVPGGGPTVEVYLLNRKENLYGQRLVVEYLRFIRPEQKFLSRELMRERMLKDIEEAHAYFRENEGV